jgi:anti-sigma B factor antagonist
MHVELRQRGDVVVVDLQGKLTAGLGDQILRDTIDELLAAAWKRIVLNLTRVPFVDSAGVGELVAGLRTAQRFGAAIKLVSAADRVQAALYVARLLPIFDVHPSEEAAIQAFAGIAPAS